MVLICLVDCQTSYQCFGLVEVPGVVDLFGWVEDHLGVDLVSFLVVGLISYLVEVPSLEGHLGVDLVSYLVGVLGLEDPGLVVDPISCLVVGLASYLVEVLDLEDPGLVEDLVSYLVEVPSSDFP